MKVVVFNRDFKMKLPSKEIVVNRNKKYIFSDFVIKSFIDSVMKQNGQKEVQEIIKSVEELSTLFPVLDLAEPINKLKEINSLLIIRTGGIGDLLALSNVANLVTHIFRDVLKNKRFKTFFITDQKYSPVFKFFESMVQPIYYFHDPVDKVLRNYNIFGTEHTRSIFFEGLIEEREDNWYDIQMERMNLNSFALYDKINPDYLTKNPKLHHASESELRSKQAVLKKGSKNIVDKISKYKKDDTKTILIHHRASAWIRTFNIADVVETLKKYFDSKSFQNYKLITFPRNYTRSDTEYFKGIKENNPELYDKVDEISTSDLNEFFYIVSTANGLISSDTAAFHFREGIGKFGIGLYSSFPCRMRTTTYEYTSSYDILFKDCEFVNDVSHYIGCASHFKTPYEICVFIARHYKEYLQYDHNFKRGNRIPNQEFVSDLENFVKNIGMDTLMEQGIFQYAPCCNSQWNTDFKPQLLAIYENERLIDNILNGY